MADFVLLDSVISGAVAGLIVAVAVGFFGWTRYRFRRRRQWTTLQKAINQSYIDYTRVPEIDRHGPALREAAYRALDSAISAHLASGLPDLRFEERYQIEKALKFPRHLANHYKAPMGTGAHKAFNELLKVKALKLKYEVLEPDPVYMSYLIEEIPHR